MDAWTRQPPHFFKFLNFFLYKSRKFSKIVSVLRSALVERFFVSRMQDFFKEYYTILNLEGHQNCINGLKVTAILLNLTGWWVSCPV